MKRVWPLVAFLWGAVVIGIAVNLVSTPIGALLQDRRNLVVAGAALLLLGVLSGFLFRHWRHQQLADEFSLFTPSERLSPEDVGFQVVAPGVPVAGSRRPYHPEAYIPRVAVPYAERHAPESRTALDEAALVERLERGDSFLLIGRPTEGKTRTLFEVAKRLRGFMVVRPRRDRPPGADAVALLRGRRVLLLIDDLGSFAGSAIDLHDFYQQLGSSAALCALAAACRDGHELAELRLETTPLQRIFEGISLKLALRRPDQDQQDRLKHLLGSDPAREYPTLGAICMDDAFEVMRQRFDVLPPSVQDCFRSLQLLAAGGVEPFTRQRVRGVLVRIFERAVDGAGLRDAVRQLAGHGFVLSAEDSDPVLAEAAFVSGPDAGAFYVPGRDPAHDLQRLIPALVAEADPDGLHQLAVSLYQRGDTGGCVAVFETIVRDFRGREGFETSVAYAHYNLAVTHGRLGAMQAAVDAYTAALELKVLPPEMVALALGGRAGRRAELGDPEGALADYTAAIELPGAPAEYVSEALVNRGVIRGTLQDHEGAIADYTAVTVMPAATRDALAKALLNRAMRTSAVDRDAALADLNGVIDLPGAPAEDVASARLRRGVLRAEHGDHVEALADLTAALEAPGKHRREALFQRGNLHGEMGNGGRAIADYDQALAMPNGSARETASTLVNRGVQKGRQGDRAGAIADFTAASALAGAPAQEIGFALTNRSVMKAELGDRDGAIADNRAALALPGLPPFVARTARENLIELGVGPVDAAPSRSSETA
jgi:tetratricopeptide (TPR) repeat protein